MRFIYLCSLDDLSVENRLINSNENHYDSEDSDQVQRLIISKNTHQITNKYRDKSHHV